MKTSEEVSKWIRSQWWYDTFASHIIVYNTQLSRKDTEYLLKSIIKGEHGEDSILDAFGWDKAKEGFDFWNEVNEKFMDWYYEGEDSVGM